MTISIILSAVAAVIGISCIKRYKGIKKLKMNLVKYSDTDKVTIVDIPDDIFEDNIEEVKDNDIYQSMYDSFVKTLITEVPREDLDNFYRNFKTIKRVRLSFITFLKNLFKRGATTLGGYEATENKISVLNNFFAKTINAWIHELLHASSRYYDKDKKIVCCGFAQGIINDDEKKKKKKKTEIYGTGINEGYTQYLTNKKFRNYDSNRESLKDIIRKIASQNVYKHQQKIAEALEMIVGEKELQSLYFRANLNGLIKILEKYATREQIYKFINYSDILCYYSKYESLDIKEVNDAKDYICTLLLKLYIKAITSKDKDINVSSKKVKYFIDNCLPYNSEKRHLDLKAIKEEANKAK